MLFYHDAIFEKDKKKYNNVTNYKEEKREFASRYLMDNVYIDNLHEYQGCAPIFATKAYKIFDD